MARGFRRLDLSARNCLNAGAEYFGDEGTGDERQNKRPDG